jgi:hypothetical protein
LNFGRWSTSRPRGSQGLSQRATVGGGQWRALTEEEPVGDGAPPDDVVGDSSSKAVENVEDVEIKLLPSLNSNERTWWWPAMVNGGSREQRKVEAGEREC